MTPEIVPRLSIYWTDEGKNNLRAIDRATALSILHCIDRYLSARQGDAKKLRPPRTDFRLRCGDYRVLYDPVGNSGIQVTSVVHRSVAYR